MFFLGLGLLYEFNSETKTFDVSVVRRVIAHTWNAKSKSWVTSKGGWQGTWFAEFLDAGRIAKLTIVSRIYAKWGIQCTHVFVELTRGSLSWKRTLQWRSMVCDGDKCPNTRSACLFSMANVSWLVLVENGMD